MFEGEVSENFPIKGDILFLQKRNESRVRKTVLFKQGGEAHVPKAAEVALLIFPMGERVSASVTDGFVGLSFFLRATIPETLHLAENIFPSFERVHAFLYSGHGASLISWIR